MFLMASSVEEKEKWISGMLAYRKRYEHMKGPAAAPPATASGKELPPASPR
jgi:hypothetical protein